MQSKKHLTECCGPAVSNSNLGWRPAVLITYVRVILRFLQKM